MYPVDLLKVDQLALLRILVTCAACRWLIIELFDNRLACKSCIPPPEVSIQG